MHWFSPCGRRGKPIKEFASVCAGSCRPPVWPADMIRFPSTFPKTKEEGTVWSLLFFLERMRGIEPPLSAWEAGVLPMNYIRV